LWTGDIPECPLDWEAYGFDPIINVVSNLLSPGLHTLAIVLLASVVAGERCACDDLETLVMDEIDDRVQPFLVADTNGQRIVKFAPLPDQGGEP
jgi:hypothetical protein